MHADFELTADGLVAAAPSGRGGPRPGSGRPKGYSPKEADGDEQYQSESTKRSIRKSEASIAETEAKAALLALKLEVESGRYLSREAYREASATLLAEAAQALRSIPDLLERKVALPPAAVVLVEQTIDGVLLNLSQGLELFTEQEPGR